MTSFKIIFSCFALMIYWDAIAAQLDVLDYEVTIEPDIEHKSITGSVRIRFILPASENSLFLDCGNLQIEALNGSAVKTYTKHGDQLTIELTSERKDTNEVIINYSGEPSRGLFFDPEKNQAHTIYFTNFWMVCNFSIQDKARINLNIILDKGLTCIANGRLSQVTEEKGKSIYHWTQNFETPAYTFGFVIGEFITVENQYQTVKIINHGKEYSPEELTQIFTETANMMSFFEEKSGIKYDQSTYSQILIGDHYQEMSGFSVLKDSYGKMVLGDSTETNLISHELAHQWWGNRITCKSLNHFWLNEAMATYMSAAYNEYRFGAEKYNADIDSYFKVYQGIKKRNKDKPLVFPDWKNPSGDDRNIVYFKGAYVLHLLREELGDQIFWEALEFYSQKYFDKSVSTQDFKDVFEEVSGRNLDKFFNEWVFDVDGRN